MHSRFILSFLFVAAITGAAFGQTTQQAPITAQVQSVYPHQNAVSVPVADSLVIQFTQATPIVASSLSDTTFVLISAQSGWGQGVIKFDSATNTITFRPNRPFFVGELVTAEATKKILWDSAGMNVPIRGFAWQFYGKVSVKTYGTFSLHNSIPVPSFTSIDVVSDIAGNNKIDFGTNSSDSLRVFFNSGDGVNYSEISLPNYGGLFSFNYLYNNYQDIFGQTGFFNNIDGTHFTVGNFQHLQDVGFTHPYYESFDADLDGVPDLLGGGTGDSMRIFYIHDSTMYLEKNFNCSSEPYQSIFFDANNDGALDMVVTTTNGLFLLFNDGYGNFGAPIKISTLGSGWIQCADYDNDGWPDILVTGTGDLDVLHNNHDSTFTDTFNKLSSLSGDGESYGMTIGDLNGTGSISAAITLGIRWKTGDSNYIFTAMNDGTGTFHIAQIWRTPGYLDAWLNLKCADLRNSGALDILMGDPFTNSVMVFQNDTSVKPVSIVENNTNLPPGYAFDFPYPNPASNNTTISYSTPNAQQVNLSLYNNAGQLVAIIQNGLVDGGLNNLTYDCSQIPSGTYLLRLTSGGYTISQSFTIIH